jgi:site-specific DNA-methyltransferase (adenine-specific)
MGKRTKKELGNLISISCEGSDTLPFARITPFQGDLKDLSEENYNKLKREILTNGFAEPISVWKNNGHNYCLNGHQRLRVITQMVMKEGYACPPLPINWVEAKDEAAAKRIVLALTSQYGAMTDQGLYEFMSEAGINANELIDSFNFPEIDMDKFQAEYFKDLLPPEIDEIPEIDESKVWVKMGDEFQLGEHRLVCGDSAIYDDNAFFRGTKINLLLTDPPYGVNYHHKNDMLNEFGKGNRVQREFDNDAATHDEMKSVLCGAFSRAKLNMANDASFYVFCPTGDLLVTFLESLETVKLQYKQLLVWVKNNLVLGRMDYHHKHEGILYGWNEKHKWNGPSNEVTVWEFNKPHVSELHPTTKPVDLICKAIENSSKANDIVYDPFGGSGTTLIACEHLKRKCFMVEIDPYYCQVIIERWEKLTGKKAKVNATT